jgi:hypothetical protein
MGLEELTILEEIFSGDSRMPFGNGMAKATEF